MASRTTDLNPDAIAMPSTTTNCTTNSATFDASTPYNTFINDTLARKITQILVLEDIEEKDQIISDLRRHGRQVLVKYEQVLIPDVYLAEINNTDDHSDASLSEFGEKSNLLELIKQHVFEQWEAACKDQSRIWTFINNVRDENRDHFEAVLRHTAEYGNTYTKSSSILAVTLQLLFEGVDNHCLKTESIFTDLFDTVTREGLQGCHHFAQYISDDDLKKQLDDPASALFLALRMFNCDKIPALFKQHKIADASQSLYSLAIDNVTKHGWLAGVESVKSKIPPIKYQPLLQTVKVMIAPAPNPIPPVKPVDDNSSEVLVIDWNRKPVERQLSRGEDFTTMPFCAERSIMELLKHFEQALGENIIPRQEILPVIQLLERLRDELEKQELFSGEISMKFQNLGSIIKSNDHSRAVRVLEELLQKIRPIDLVKVQRLVGKAKQAGEHIQGKDIVLLIGETGTGKSTTIQFLAGCEMREVKVEIDSGKYLDHITTTEPSKYLELENVISSPFSQSETRYLTPVTIPLKDIFGSHKNGSIILCDAPGIGDTAGPEVDIANGVGVIEALGGCRSVKILALSSYKSLGDRGQGIQKLAYILINMIHGVRERLNSIEYAFTKYPSGADISAILLDIKTAKVDKDPSLSSDDVFVAVLEDMIEKTENGKAHKIDLLHGDRKPLIKALERIPGIQNPKGVFRFSMSGETRESITNQIERDKSNIVCSLKYKDSDLVLYYLSNLKIFNELIQHSTAQDAYEVSKKSVSESFVKYCAEITGKISRLLASRDGLRQEDIEEYRTSLEYIHRAQVLREYLGSDVVSPKSLLENMHSELHKKYLSLKDKDLHSPLVKIYLDNLCLLKRSFETYESYESYESLYKDCRRGFQERFDSLVQSVDEHITSNKFKQVAEVILHVSTCIPILNDHLRGTVEEQYKYIVNSVSQYLRSLIEKAVCLLAAPDLSENDLEDLKNYSRILTSAKETLMLQNQVSTYVETVRKKTTTSEEQCKDLNEIYNDFIAEVVKYFDNIRIRIEDLLANNKSSVSLPIKKLIDSMKSLRDIPGIKSRTAEIYYRTVDSVHRYMQQCQIDAEKLLTVIDQQAGISNYRNLEQILSRLKNAESIGCISSENCKLLMLPITEMLIDRAQHLQDSLNKLNLTLKNSDNIHAAQEILDKVEQMRTLERAIPELKVHREKIFERFQQIMKETFDRIEKAFDLQDRDVSRIRDHLTRLETIKVEYEKLYPARIYIRKQGYENINIVICEIEKVRTNQDEELKAKETEQCKLESQLNELKLNMQKYNELASSETNRNIGVRKNDSVTAAVQKNTMEASSYLKEKGFSNIKDVESAVAQTQEVYDKTLEWITNKSVELDSCISPLESIRKEYELLLTSQESKSPEEKDFLREKGQESYELLEKHIQNKKRIIAQCEQNQQRYNFRDRFDASMANDALLYLSQSVKENHVDVRTMASRISDLLIEYIHEYSAFLNNEIGNKFKSVCQTNPTKDPFQCSYDLEKCVRELQYMKKFPLVADCLSNEKELVDWIQEFRNKHTDMTDKMETYKMSEKTKDLNEVLIIADALSCLDKFCFDPESNRGFRDLYKRYHREELMYCKETVRNIITLISNRDYETANRELCQTEQNSLSGRDSINIQNELNHSLKKLIIDITNDADRLIDTIKGNQHTSKIQSVRESYEKVRFVLEQETIHKFLDKDIKNKLEMLEKNQDGIISKAVSEVIGSIETYLDNDQFLEAEQTMINLNCAYCAFSRYCTVSSCHKSIENLRKRFGDIDNEILKRYNFKEIENYSKKSPKDLYSNLQAAYKGIRDEKYEKASKFMSLKIQTGFDQSIAQYETVSWGECMKKIPHLRSVLSYIPDTLEIVLTEKISAFEKSLRDKETQYSKDLDKSLEGDDNNCVTMGEIGSLTKYIHEQSMSKLIEKVREEIKKRMSNYQVTVENASNKQDMQAIIINVKKINIYKEVVGLYIPDIKDIYGAVRDITIKSLSNCSDILSKMSSLADEHMVEQAYSSIVICLEFCSTFDKRNEKFFPKDILDNVAEALCQMSHYFYKNSEKFKTSNKTMDIDELDQVVRESKRWDTVLQLICRRRHYACALIKSSLKDLDNVMSYKDMVCELEKTIITLKDKLDTKYISVDGKVFESNHDEFFRDVDKSLTHLKKIDSKLKDVLSSPLDVKELEEKIRKEFQKIGEQLTDIASKSELTLQESDQFRRYYNYLLSVEKHAHLKPFNVQHYLKTAKDKILQVVLNLHQEAQIESSTVEKVAQILTKMKFFAENLSMFETEINTHIDGVLRVYKKNGNMGNLVGLVEKLKESAEGVRLVLEHSSLKGVNWKQLRGKIQNQDNLPYVLANMNGDDISKEFLEKSYADFDVIYKRLMSSFIVPANQRSEKGLSLERLTASIKNIVDTVTRSARSNIWNRSLRDAIPELLAHIFAVWTLINNEDYNELRGVESPDDYLLMPHVGQVVAIFRILAIGYVEAQKIPSSNITYKTKISNDLVNNLVEIGTGEGKSVVLAVTACVFALIGADVVCSCYSDVLSTRDMHDFAPVFRALGIEERVKYGTFNKLCEQLLNEQCDLREKVRDMIRDNKSILDVAQKKKIERAKVLLIDEVDVFLSEKFYGGIYTPSLILNDPCIKELLDSLWKNRSICTLNHVKALPAYQKCANRWSNWLCLLEEAVKDMVATLRSFKPGTYLVKDDKIVYVVGESVVDNVILGYDTIWAYYHENEQEPLNISSISLKANVGIIVNCGAFSYAEMPYEFSYIAGVSGTLRTLAESEKNILKNVYHIYRSTFMPSVFGACNRTYSNKTDVIVVTESDYFARIHEEIEDVCRAQRAILVFFESEEKLTAFYAWLDSSPRKENVQVIKETVSEKERELYVRRAATVGKVTLLTRTFGRGTDFICSSPQLVLNGGVHVLQAFFSKELSEEYQIMGRGARQGEKGSYRMILLDKDLEWILGSSWNVNLGHIAKDAMYQTLNKSREIRYESKCGTKQFSITQCKSKHKASRDFMTAITEGKILTVREFLIEQNRGANIVTGISRTVLLMDATGSMSDLLTTAKETVCTMFEHASGVLTEEKVPNDAFQMQFAIYRNYSSKNKILQVSPWETKGSNLRAFMNTISPDGGQGNEAIEIGLWHAVKESESEDSISQVILIGDAPANSQEEVHTKRAQVGEQHWKTTIFDKPTYYEIELQKLKDKNIPVHAFYLHKNAEENFQKIALKTGGKCKWLDIHSSKVAELLTKFVTKEVIRKAAGNQGDKAVKRYENMFTS